MWKCQTHYMCRTCIWHFAVSGGVLLQLIPQEPHAESVCRKEEGRGVEAYIVYFVEVYYRIFFSLREDHGLYQSCCMVVFWSLNNMPLLCKIGIQLCSSLVLQVETGKYQFATDKISLKCFLLQTRYV